MGGEDNEPRQADSELETSGDDKPFLEAAQAPSRGGKLARAGLILGVIVVSGVLVWLIHAMGGDERAPVGDATTAGTTTKESVTTASTTAMNIRDMDWKKVTGAKPMVQDVEDVLYADLNGGGDEEAIVLVRLEGAGAYLSYYVYAWDDGMLEIIFEETELENGRVTLGSTAGSFVEITPAAGDPASLQYKTYRWNDADEEFEVLSLEFRPRP